MKQVVIFAHPNNQSSFNKAILEYVLAGAQQAGAETVVRDLYTMQFNPVLSWAELQAANQNITPAEIKYEQDLLRDADLITLIYPLWWMGFPAILKGYLDRVLSHGFAYKTENGISVGLLQEKKMQHFITIGSSKDKYQEAGFDVAIRHCLVDGLFNFCGITDIDHQLIGDIYVLSEAQRQEILQQAEQKTQQNLTALFEQHEQA